MAAALLVGLHDNEEEEHHNRNVMAERLPRPRNYVVHFPARILISFHRLQRHLIFNLVEELLYYFITHLLVLCTNTCHDRSTSATSLPLLTKILYQQSLLTLKVTYSDPNLS